MLAHLEPLRGAAHRHADRGRDDLRHRLHGDERARVHAGRCRGVRHPALCRAGKLADSAARLLERTTLAWNPAYAKA